MLEAYADVDMPNPPIHELETMRDRIERILHNLATSKREQNEPGPDRDDGWDDDLLDEGGSRVPSGRGPQPPFLTPLVEVPG